MTTAIDPKKRYALRAIELGKTDPELSQLNPIEEVRTKAGQDNLTTDRVISTFLEAYAERPLFGERSYEVVQDTIGQQVRKYLPAYSTISYDGFHNQVKALSMAWRNHPYCQVKPTDFVAIMGFASPQFMAVDVATSYCKGVKVPLQSATSGGDLNEIFTNIAPVIIAVTVKDLPVVIEHAIQQDSVKSVVVFNYDERVHEEKAIVENAQQAFAESKTDTQLFTFQSLIEYGQQFEFEFLPLNPADNDKMGIILHSSGSTGKPKGAMIDGHALNHTWRGRGKPLPIVIMVNAPLNHLMGRWATVRAANNGGTAYFTLKPDLSSLFEDIRLARPTFISFLPRILELINQYYQNEVTKRHKVEGGDKTAIEAAVKAEMKSSFLGNRLIGASVGSAPTSPKVKAFMRDCFDIMMLEGYGNTEAGSGGLTYNDKINRETVLEYKLRDVPELGYFTTDKPHPRGELCVKTKYGIKGYYKAPEATKNLFDEEGFSCTGDIVEEIEPDHIIIIDRRKDVLKLSQGEYVAAGTLGTVYEAGSSVIHQIYVYGNSHRSYLLAVIVPEEAVIQELLGDRPTDNQVKNLIRQELHKVAQKEELKSFEIPKDFIIEPIPFTQANGLLSSARKRLRPALKRKYAPTLESIYESHEQLQEAKIAALKDPNSTLSTFEKLVILVESQLGIEGIETEKPRTFKELGGDSLGAALFSMTLEEIFEVNIGADELLSPTGNLKAWAKLIEEEKNSTVKRPSFALIHGKDATTIYAKDLQLNRFIPIDILEKATQLPLANVTPKTVLLTGANGFLGHIITLEWMKVLAKNGGTLICMVRAKDDKAAYQRLEKEFVGLDENFEKEFKILAPHHLKVIAGDISKPSLRLSESAYQALTKSVDRICHVAALVNHRLAYQHLFAPNVLGSTEIIRLALTHKRKPIDFISTSAVYRFIKTSSKGLFENAPLHSEITLSDNYAVGYGASKWAVEHLLHQTNQQFQLPVNIVRCDMILADQRYKGQVNLSDMLSRLLYSVMITGLAPTSFYKLAKNGQRSNAHYNGVPVDVLSKAIVGLYQKTHQDCITYHAQNYLEDTVSLDSFVDWIASAGYPIDRLDNYKDWHSRMETKLKALPEAQRKHSALDVLLAYSRPQAAKGYHVDSQQFKTLVEDLEELGGLSHLSEVYIHKYLGDIEGLLY